MPSLYIKGTVVDTDRDCVIGEIEIQESNFSKIGDLFRYCQREYGGCVSNMYIDTKEGKTRKVGWVFEKKVDYEKGSDPTNMQTWITVHQRVPEIVVINHYHEFK